MRLQRRAAVDAAQTNGASQETSSGPNRLLEIFVLPRCFACQTATELVEHLIAVNLPGIVIRLIDLSRPGTLRPAAVFAVPTYLLDGRVISLGNPDPAWLLSQLRIAQPST